MEAFRAIRQPFALFVTGVILLGIVALTALGVASVHRAGQFVTKANTTTTTASPQAERYRPPPSINPCDDFAVGMLMGTLLFGGLYVRGRRNRSA